MTCLLAVLQISGCFLTVFYVLVPIHRRGLSILACIVYQASDVSPKVWVTQYFAQFCECAELTRKDHAREEEGGIVLFESAADETTSSYVGR